MPLAPVARLKKSEIIWLANNRCKHSHHYLEHFSCYLEECPEGFPLDFKIGFFDLEFHNLKASVGVLFGYCIKEYGIDKIYEDWLLEKDFKKGRLPDYRVIKNCVNDMRKFDVLVSYYGSRCDVPYIRTKALMNDIEFPEYGELVHLDLYYHIRNKFSLHSNSLQIACETLLGTSAKTRIKPAIWMGALFGDIGAITYIADHCREDVKDLERLYNKTIQFKKRLDRSA